MTAPNTSEAPSPSGWFCFFGLLFYFLAGFIVAPLLGATFLFGPFLFIEKMLPFTFTFWLLTVVLCYGGRRFKRKYRPSGGSRIPSILAFIFWFGLFYRWVLGYITGPNYDSFKKFMVEVLISAPY